MPADVSTSKNFLLTTDFPLDKVILLRSGSAVIPFPTAGMLVTIPHGLPFTPLVDGNWSLTSDFSVSYEYGSGTFPSSNTGASNFDISMDVYADSTNVYVSPTNVSGSQQTIYYRIFGLEPSDSEADIAFTASTGDQFALNTDYNYTKLFISDVINSPSLPSTETIDTNLGYKPQVMTWTTNVSGERRPTNITFLLSGAVTDYGVKVADNTVDIVFSSLSFSDRLDYRIYLDDNA